MVNGKRRLNPDRPKAVDDVSGLLLLVRICYDLGGINPNFSLQQEFSFA
jgi:hypothetical protein